MQTDEGAVSPTHSASMLRAGNSESESLRTKLERLTAENEKIAKERKKIEDQMIAAKQQLRQLENQTGTWMPIFALSGVVVAMFMMMLFAPRAFLHEDVAYVADKVVDTVKILEAPRGFVNDTYQSMFPPESGVELGLVGKRLKAEEGLEAKHPVIIIPGFVSSYLELWQAHPECTFKFRARIWGSIEMQKHIAIDPKCWMLHLALNVSTGLDAEGVKIRAVEGLAGGLEFSEVYWLWNQIVENLIAIGYDSSNFAMLTYDWRLNCGLLEKRDRYFTKLMHMVEIWHEQHGEKVVLMGHSMGGQMLQYFLKWVESDVGGKGGRSWVDQHIHASVSIAGANMGMPKSVSALVSGEMKDTSNLGVVDQLIELIGVTSRYNRVKLFQTWYSLAQMLPKGGDAVWGSGDEGSAPDDIADGKSCGGWMMKSTSDVTQEPEFADKEVMEGKMMPNVSFSKLPEFLTTTHPDMQHIIDTMSYGYSENVAQNNDDESKWYNPLEIEMPNAPNMTYYHIYGHDKPTERAYAYQHSKGEELNRYHINTTYNDANKWIRGVCFQSGDGTLPLNGLGYLGTKQWRTKTHNPYGVRQVVREITHKEHPIYPRGGELTGDHCDVLGALAMNEDLLRIAAGKTLSDSFTSKIVEMSDNIHKRLQETLIDNASAE